MWTKLKKDYFLNFINHDISYEIYLTNFISVWSTYYSSKAFIAQLKESNDGLELENDNEFLQRGINLFTSLERLKKVNISKEDNDGNVNVSLKIMFGYPFCFECKLSRGSNEFFFNNVTQSLLRTINDLRASQTELRRLLIKKDKEIDEYKYKGGEIVLRHLKTAAFNDEEHMSNYNIYEQNFGSNSIPSNLIEKIPQTVNNLIVDNTDIKVKQESTSHVNIKQESTSMKCENGFNGEIPNTRMETYTVKEEPHTPLEGTTNSQLSDRQTNNISPRKRMKKLNL